MIRNMIKEVCEAAVARFAGGQRYVEEWDLDGLLSYAYAHFLPSRSVPKKSF